MLDLTWLQMALLLTSLHFLADFPLQGEYIAMNKGPDSGSPHWAWIMSTHCSIHSGFVLLVTGSALLFVLEFLLHFTLDVAKCKGMIGFSTDQIIHLISKYVWVALVVLNLL